MLIQGNNQQNPNCGKFIGQTNFFFATDKFFFVVTINSKKRL